ncbi:alpha,alpha-phosphotrehalase [Sporolactobacillus sp. Y61]|uniref:Alpha,alpha-phosphotrehalase n=1 Tax=Sporolactobacillus sp. Y61 TaxID=3160863 RepID=A0AAU8IBP5_9BACL
MTQPWWKQATIYQVYPKSFLDTDGDGIGDLPGITEKLDYLKKLGIEVIWLTPVYQSPQKDNGYDISDYYSIEPEYGSMKDLEQLFTEAHKRHLKIVMDMVVNHTSTAHHWFQESRKNRNNPFRDYYIWKDPKPDGGPPNNWQSKFGGSAWAWDETTGQYYLHLYDPTQADLNWENPQLRQTIYRMMNFWIDKGADGFRMDVINVISKNQRFPDDADAPPDARGKKFYTDGPRVHEFLQEMNRNVFSRRIEMMTVGEMSSTSINNCIRYTKPDRHELSMVFNFHHLKVDYPGGKKWTVARPDFLKLKQILSDWQTRMHAGGGWNALFWCNHDQPRIVSRFGDDGPYREVSAKMLATTLHMMQGTPYIYQGEEIGMTNPKYQSLSDYRDVESLNAYRMLKKKGLSETGILDILAHKSRDNGRSPMQWNNRKNAGFTSGTPWIPICPNYPEINVEAALANRQSIFYHYQKLVALRRKYPIIVEGAYELLLPNDPAIFAYLRHGEAEELLVVSNFFKAPVTFALPDSVPANRYDSHILISNYSDSPTDFRKIQLRPYESIVYHLTRKPSRSQLHQ